MQARQSWWKTPMACIPAVKAEWSINTTTSHCLLPGLAVADADQGNEQLLLLLKCT